MSVYLKRWEARESKGGQQEAFRARATEVTDLTQSSVFLYTPRAPFSRPPCICNGLPLHTHGVSSFKGKMKVQPSAINPNTRRDPLGLLLAQRFLSAVIKPLLGKSGRK